ncbi:MAG: hypothetical protein NTV28_04515 [Propionibacteriales bacterium]|nr:hypothetical protein [Propionibacteriales bacterium]
MGTPRRLPDALQHAPFSRQQALDLGLTSRQLQHQRFERLFPTVYRFRGHPMSARDWVHAARLTLPPDAAASHQTRFVELGVEVGPLFPLHFTVARDLHLAADRDRLFLHRTLVMPRGDRAGVSVAAALVGAASLLRRLDIVSLADWALHRGHVHLEELRHVVDAEPWRPGAAQLKAALSMVDPRARSLPESQLRCLLVAAGLPRPETNADVHDASGRFLACGDLVYRWLRLLLEYEGRQHALDPYQFNRDIHRYAGLRDEAWRYLQVTAAMLGAPVALVRAVHHIMVRQGYDGPAPSFSGSAWLELFDTPDSWRHDRRWQGRATS